MRPRAAGAAFPVLVRRAWFLINFEGYAEMDSMLSRSGRSNPDGKLVCRIEVMLSEETADAVIALATIGGVSKSEWMRDAVEGVVHGRLYMVRRLSCITPLSKPDEYGKN